MIFLGFASHPACREITLARQLDNRRHGEEVSLALRGTAERCARVTGAPGRIRTQIRWAFGGMDHGYGTSGIHCAQEFHVGQNAAQFRPEPLFLARPQLEARQTAQVIKLALRDLHGHLPARPGVPARFPARPSPDYS
jgi:hypothetical protein